ncbi:hypothetical protein IWX90DRAFT_40226 [Phyllosticta citrichinensis]|uniref:Secreted protein n=1 Tax=Phyllosticta citrichinensis TaxID=1130410 RepID=A0ABR1Y899_9PEZI
MRPLHDCTCAAACLLACSIASLHCICTHNPPSPEYLLHVTSASPRPRPRPRPRPHCLGAYMLLAQTVTCPGKGILPSPSMFGCRAPKAVKVRQLPARSQLLPANLGVETAAPGHPTNQADMRTVNRKNYYCTHGIGMTNTVSYHVRWPSDVYQRHDQQGASVDKSAFLLGPANSCCFSRPFGRRKTSSPVQLARQIPGTRTGRFWVAR